MGDWKCKECGYNVKSDVPPEKCPSCDKKCEFVDTTCYIPDCGNTGKDPRLLTKNKGGLHVQEKVPGESRMP